MLNYRWMYDEEPQMALTFRSGYQAKCSEARLGLPSCWPTAWKMDSAERRSCIRQIQLRTGAGVVRPTAADDCAADVSRTMCEVLGLLARLE